MQICMYDSDIQIVEETTMTQENDRRNRAEQMASIIRQNLKRAITGKEFHNKKLHVKLA